MQQQEEPPSLVHQAASVEVDSDTEDDPGQLLNMWLGELNTLKKVRGDVLIVRRSFRGAFLLPVIPIMIGREFHISFLVGQACTRTVKFVYYVPPPQKGAPTDCVGLEFAPIWRQELAIHQFSWLHNSRANMFY